LKKEGRKQTGKPRIRHRNACYSGINFEDGTEGQEQRTLFAPEQEFTDLTGKPLDDRCKVRLVPKVLRIELQGPKTENLTSKTQRKGLRDIM
jgi:hypothetical protein